MWNVVNYYLDLADFKCRTISVCVILLLEPFIEKHARKKSYILSISIITLNCEHLQITNDKIKLGSGFQMDGMVRVLNFLCVVKY